MTTLDKFKTLLLRMKESDLVVINDYCYWKATIFKNANFEIPCYEGNIQSIPTDIIDSLCSIDTVMFGRYLDNACFIDLIRIIEIGSSKVKATTLKLKFKNTNEGHYELIVNLYKSLAIPCDFSKDYEIEHRTRFEKQ